MSKTVKAWTTRSPVRRVLCVDQHGRGFSTPGHCSHAASEANLKQWTGQLMRSLINLLNFTIVESLDCKLPHVGAQHTPESQTTRLRSHESKNSEMSFELLIWAVCFGQVISLAGVRRGRAGRQIPHYDILADQMTINWLLVISWVPAETQPWPSLHMVFYSNQSFLILLLSVRPNGTTPFYLLVVFCYNNLLIRITGEIKK